LRILAVDPGKKHIGLAISDPSGTIANPLMILTHKSRGTDVDRIIEVVMKNAIEKIIVGQSIDDENGQPTFEGRQSARLAEALRCRTSVPIELWDEAYSTQDARHAQIMMGASRKKRSGHLDDLAATLILQSYLDKY